MSDPIALLARRFEKAMIAAAELPPGETVDPSLRRSDRADFQANAAMNLGKRVKRAPRDVAAAIVAHLDAGELCAKVEVAGPGFINIWLRDEALAALLREVGLAARGGIEAAETPETVVIDYSAPNVAKEMHVGHLRSTVIGDALSRVLEARGHEVVRQNHLGDWGTPFGMLIEHLLDEGQSHEEASGLGTADLDTFYRAARAKFEADPAFAERSRRRVVSLQGGDEATLQLWRRLCDESRRYFGASYGRLGVKLRDEDIKGESFYNPALPTVAADLEAMGLGRIDDGALCVFLDGFLNKDGAPLPLIVRKQDGGFGYAATDLAAIRHRTRDLGATRIIYVVGAPQSQHFAMVFAAAKAAGWLAPPARAEHVAFGSILGADKKMFKTRSGETVKLASLIDEAYERALAVVTEKNPELDAETRSAVARAVGVGAIKYADLSSDRIKDYVFDWDRMLAFEGNTAPYLMYAHARIRSIFRRAGESADFAALRIAAPAEHELAIAILGFPTTLADVERTLEPHRLCVYLYELATRFSAFYEACPVLKADSPEERRSRLALCELTARTLARGLELLGIEAPDRM